MARLASGITAAWILPLALAFVGDVVPYERRQPVLAKFLAGQMLGQAAGGILGDYFGWRTVFFVLAAVFALAAVVLFWELATNPITRAADRPSDNVASCAPTTSRSSAIRGPASCYW